MKIAVTLFIATMWLLSGTIEFSAAADPTPPSKPAAEPNITRFLQGQLLKIEGEFYLVKDRSGEEVRVHVSKDTVFDTRIKVGDKVDAQVLPDGHATSMLKAF